LTATFAGFAFTAAAYYAHIASQQLDQMRNAVNQATAANVIAQKTLEMGQRAYISIENPEVKDFRIGGKPRFSCTLRNTGHAPATRIVLIPSWGWGPHWKGKGPRPIPLGDLWTPAREDAGDILAPDETKSFNYEIKNIAPALPRLTGWDIQKVIAGKQELTVLAIVAYFDGFGHARTSWKQLRYDPYFHAFSVDSSHES